MLADSLQVLTHFLTAASESPPRSTASNADDPRPRPAPTQDCRDHGNGWIARGRGWRGSPVGRCARNLGSPGARRRLDEHAVQKLVDQSVSPLPIGRITFRGLAYEGLEFHAKLINFRGTSSCDPGGENL
jgi:hypothetical protein